MCTSLHSFSTFSNTQTNNSHSPHTAWPYAEDKSKWSIQKTGKKTRHTNQDDGKSSRKKGTLFEISHTHRTFGHFYEFISSLCLPFVRGFSFTSFRITFRFYKSNLHTTKMCCPKSQKLYIYSTTWTRGFFLLKFFSPFYSSLFRIIRLNFQIYWKKCLIFWIANSEHRFSHSQICRNNVSRSVLNATDR